MIKKRSKTSLADKIADVLKAAPTSFNPDEEVLDDTTAKLPDFDDDDQDNDQVEEELLSKFRAQTVDLLGDVDQRYAGKKGSRKDFEEDSAEELSVDDNQPDNTSSDEPESESDNENEEENQSSDDAESQSNGELSDVAADESNFQHFSQNNEANQVNKGFCVRNQLNKWESLLEMRIQMQKCLMAANKLPQKAHFTLLDKEGEGFRDKAKEIRTNVEVLLGKLLQLQDMGIKQYPETKKLTKRKEAEKEKVSDGESDEEITSSSESEEDSDSENLQKSPAKRRKLDDFETDISTIHDKYKDYRNQTIENWNTKTRSAVVKNSSQPHSVVSQINYILSDKNKLIKKTQLKKSEFHILGLDNTEREESNEEVKQVEEYNTEIFDDTDFYHQILRELIEAKSADITDPVQLGRQWIQLQSLRSKMKRKIDTRATKGRKIRYAVHSKLVNFMAPMDNQTWTEEAKNELYSSLFGKIQKRT